MDIDVLKVDPYLKLAGLSPDTSPLPYDAKLFTFDWETKKLTLLRASAEV